LFPAKAAQETDSRIIRFSSALQTPRFGGIFVVPSNLPKIGRAATGRNQTHTAKRCNELECHTRELLTYLDTKLAVEKACRLPSAFWLKKCGPQFLQRPREHWHRRTSCRD